MNGWKRSVFWEGLPLLIFLGAFGFLAIINWDYESKLLTPDNSASGSGEVYLGPILLATAAGMTVLASVILLVVRLLVPRVISSTWKLLPLLLVTFFLIFPSLFIVLLGPADITMIEQMRKVPPPPSL
jgi:hypothetical protein